MWIDCIMLSSERKHGLRQSHDGGVVSQNHREDRLCIHSFIISPSIAFCPSRLRHCWSRGSVPSFFTGFTASRSNVPRFLPPGSRLICRFSGYDKCSRNIRRTRYADALKQRRCQPRVSVQGRGRRCRCNSPVDRFPGPIGCECVAERRGGPGARTGDTYKYTTRAQTWRQLRTTSPTFAPASSALVSGSFDELTIASSR